ncbi:MAG: DedA family protein [Bacteroidales bacterium]|nr:DedA family protein [Candidatus Colimorpha onthohippi]
MLTFLQTWGLVGLFIGSFLAATVVPFSSDALMVGMLLAGGNPVYCLLVATIGNWLGGLTSFGIGWLGRWQWIERWFKVKRETLQKQQARISKYGAWLALLTWLPIVGDVFAIALGFYHCPPIKCGIYMLVGKFIRFAIWSAFFF